MSIEVLHRCRDHSNRVVEWVKRFALDGWNTNTQFFVIFLGLLGIHLWMVQVFIQSADLAEPGDPQGYFTSQGGSSPQPASVSPEETGGTGEPLRAMPIREKKIPEFKPPGSPMPVPETLVLSDSDKERLGDESAESHEIPILELIGEKGTSQGQDSREAEIEGEDENLSPVQIAERSGTILEIEKAPPVVGRVDESGQESKPVSPQLTDLIVGSPAGATLPEEKTSTAESGNDDTEPDSPDAEENSRGMRMFRELP